MSENSYHVIILDDDQELGELFKDYLQSTEVCSVTYVFEESDFWDCLSKQYFDIIFLDYKLPESNGLDILARMMQNGVNIPTVMMTGEGSEYIAARAIQSGAIDYLVKGQYSFTILPSLIQKAVRMREMQQAMQTYIDQIQYQARLLNNMRDAVVVWDLDGIVTYWNSAAEHLYGLPASEQLSRHIGDVYLPLFEQLFQIPDAAEADGMQFESRIQRPNGEQVWISAHVMPLYTGDDLKEPGGSMIVSRDITESKIAEEKLQKSEARYRAIVEEHQTEMICRFFPDGSLNFVNEVFCQYYRRGREQLIGSNFLDFVTEEERDELRSQLAELQESAPVLRFEQRVLPGPGEVRWEDWVARAIYDSQGELIEVQAVGRDITRRKQMEEQIQAAQTHLAQAARLSSIGELAASVAHQISNPLTTVIAEAQILLHDSGRQNPSAESAEAILQAGWRAQSVINELMKFSQPAHSIQALVSVNETIESALLLASAHVHVSGVGLNVDLQEDLPTISGNSSQLTDLWVNLLLLARSSFQDGEDRSINIRSRLQNPTQIDVYITDNGNPIPPEEYDTIFEPRLIPTGSGRGTGMELSLCREIVRQNHGQIRISGDGKETTFQISFPVEGK